MCIVVHIQGIKKLVHHPHKVSCFRGLFPTSKLKPFGDYFAQNLQSIIHIQIKIRYKYNCQLEPDEGSTTLCTSLRELIFCHMHDKFLKLRVAVVSQFLIFDM